MPLFISIHRHNTNPLYCVTAKTELLIGEDRYGIPCFGDDVEQQWLSIIYHENQWSAFRDASNTRPFRLKADHSNALSVRDAQIVMIPTTA